MLGRKEYMKTYSLRNKEYKREYDKNYRALNAERIYARKKDWARKNKAKIWGYYKKHRVANRERDNENNRNWKRLHRESVSASWKAYKEQNLDKIRERGREKYYKRKSLDPVRIRLNNIRNKYRIMSNYSDDLAIKIVKSKCEICGRSGNTYIDHDHKNKFIRGALCRDCNLGLGGFKDDIGLLNNAIKYLEKFNASTTSKDPSNSAY